jgi:WD40 repeat protein
VVDSDLAARVRSRWGAEQVADIFISYSRRDSAFVQRLQRELKDRGKDVWVDVEGIRDAEVFPAALSAAVEGSDGFVFVISPDSVGSEFCELEVSHAVELNKRIVPLALREVPDEQVPQGIRERNWIPVGDDGDFDQGVERLVMALDTDLAWTKEHTNWLLKALEWDAKGRDRSLLLRGSELAAAERWLSGAAGKDPEPTSLHTEYVLAGRAAATRRQRIAVGISVGVAAVAVGLLIFALISRGRAITAQQTSESRALAAQSVNEQVSDPELAILLGMQAVKTKPTPDALFALRGAIDASPLRARLPVGGPQSCTPPVGGPGLAYAPGGARLAEALCDGTVRLFDARTSRAVGRFGVPGGTGAIGYSPSGSLLAVGSDRGVSVLDAGTGAMAVRLPVTAAVNGLAFSPDGKLIAATTQDQMSNSSLVVWPARGGAARTLASGAFNPLYGVTALRHVVFTRDGRSLIVGGAPGVRVYDVATGRLERTLPGTQVADDVALSGDGRTLAVSVLAYNESQISVTFLPVASSTSSPDTVTLWTVRDWHPRGTLATFLAVEQPVIAFSPDGTRVAIGGADGRAGLWAARTRQPIVSFPGSKAPIVAIAFSSDGNLVATGVADGTAAVWHAGSFETRDLDTADAITNGGGTRSRFAITDTIGARFWTYPGLRELPPLRMLSPGAQPGSEGGAMSPDGTLAWWHTAKNYEIWNTVHRRIVGTLPPGTAAAITFSSDDRRVGYFDPQSPMELVDPTGGHKLVLQGNQPVCPVGWRWAVFTPDGRYVAASTLCGQTRVWNAASGALISRFDEPVQISLTAFSADDTHLALGLNDGTVTIWDVRRPRPTRPVRVLAGSTAAIGLVGYSPDGELLISSSFDGTARIWDPVSGRTLRIFPDAPAALFLPDGNVATSDAQGVIRFYEACPLCTNAQGLLALARTRVTRQLTPIERATFVNGS